MDLLQHSHRWRRWSSRWLPKLYAMLLLMQTWPLEGVLGQEGAAPISDITEISVGLETKRQESTFSTSSLTQDSTFSTSSLIQDSTFLTSSFTQDFTQTLTEGMPPSSLSKPPTSETTVTSSQDTIISSSQDPIISSSQDTIISSSQDPIISNSQDPIISSSQDTIILSSQDPIISSSQDTIILSSQDPIISSSQDPIISSTQDTIILSSQDPIISSSQDTIILSSQDPIISSSQDPIISSSQDTIILSSQDPIISSSQDTIISSSQDTIILSSQDPIISSSQDTIILSSQDPIISSSQDTIISSSQDPIISSSQDTIILSSQDPIISSSQDTIILSSQDPIISSSQDTILSSTQDPIISSSQDTIISSSQDTIIASTQDPSTDTSSSQTTDDLTSFGIIVGTTSSTSDVPAVPEITSSVTTAISDKAPSETTAVPDILSSRSVTYISDSLLLTNNGDFVSSTSSPDGVLTSSNDFVFSSIVETSSLIDSVSTTLDTLNFEIITTVSSPLFPSLSFDSAVISPELTLRTTTDSSSLLADGTHGRSSSPVESTSVTDTDFSATSLSMETSMPGDSSPTTLAPQSETIQDTIQSSSSTELPALVETTDFEPTGSEATQTHSLGASSLDSSQTQEAFITAYLSLSITTELNSGSSFSVTPDQQSDTQMTEISLDVTTAVSTSSSDGASLINPTPTQTSLMVSDMTSDPDISSDVPAPESNTSLSEGSSPFSSVQNDTMPPTPLWTEAPYLPYTSSGLSSVASSSPDVTTLPDVSGTTLASLVTAIYDTPSTVWTKGSMATSYRSQHDTFSSLEPSNGSFLSAPSLIIVTDSTVFISDFSHMFSLTGSVSETQSLVSMDTEVWNASHSSSTNFSSDVLSTFQDISSELFPDHSETETLIPGISSPLTGDVSTHNKSLSFTPLSSSVIFSDLTELASTQISLSMSTNEISAMSSDMFSEITLVPSGHSSSGLLTESQFTTPMWMSSIHVSSLEMNGTKEFSATSLPTVITESSSLFNSSSGDIIIKPTPSTSEMSVMSSELEISNSTVIMSSTVILSPTTTTMSSTIPSPSVTPTATTPAPGTTVPTIENSKNKTEFWVVTRFRIPLSANIQSPAFKQQTETGLANAYYLARVRGEEIKNGTYVPLTRRRKRLASATNDPSTQVDMVSATRPTNASAVDVTYVVQQNGQILPGTQASEQLNLLSEQEVAIVTGQLVSMTAQPYIQPASSKEDMTKWIILGCVLGGVLLIAVIVIIIVCCCCCKSKKQDEVSAFRDAELVKVTRLDKRSSEYVDDEPDKERSLPIGSRKYKYAVTPEDTVNDPLYSSIEKKPPVKVPRKTKSGIQSSAEAQAAKVEDERPTRVARQDTPQRKRKKKPLDSGQDIRSVYEKQIASLQTAEDPLDYSQGEYTMTSQPTVEEEGDLLENAEEERKKNKQRLRAKKMMELDHSSPVKSGEPTLRAYENAQKEIDKVLGPRDDNDDDDEEEDNKKKKHKQKGKNKKEKKGEDNEAFSDDDDEKVEKKEETLEEARHRMHKLLDDAFSLISHSKSSIGNKVQPSSSDDQRSQPSSAREDRSVQANMESPRLESKKHTPIHVHRSHEPYDSSGLVTWSPYRASDEIAIISLPNTQTNLSSVPPQQERLTTSTFTESMPSSIRTSYYATQPGEPIVIKTKNMDSNLPPNGSRSRNGSFSKPDDERGHSHRTANGGYHQETFQNPVYENTLPLRPTNRYTDPYHGLASYQDLPVSQIVEPNKRNGRALKPSAWQEERNKLSQPNSGSSSPRGGVIDVRRHIPPQRGEKKNLDEVDVIKESLQPGASPQPLINSLREELQVLSSKKIVENQTKKGSSDSFRMKSNGSSQSYPHDESVSSWGSMHRNTSNV